MCAKKATTAAVKKAAAKPVSKPSANKAAENGMVAVPSPTPAKSSAKAASAKTVPTSSAVKATVGRSLSSRDIGEVAGEVWGFLSAGGPQTVVAIKKSVKAPADVITAAIGWLAREDKLEFTTSGKTLKLALK